MADKKFSELTTASEIKNEDFMALSQNTGGGLVSLKATILAIANKMLKGINFTSDLQTEDKTVIGAINEVAQGGGGGGSSTLGGLNDVDIDDTTLADGQALVYNGTEEKWVNGQGGGGTGGHTIIDENGNSMTARAGLQFVGGANVSDDATNNKTIVDLASAGGIDGVFIDTDNVIVNTTTISASGLSYTATEDCFAYIYLWGSQSTKIKIDGIEVGANYSTDKDVYLIPLKKGQTITTTAGNSNNTYQIYGIQTGTTHSKFQPVIYSLEEREIGVWTDGKPLYEKTFYKDNLQTTFSDFIKFVDMDNPETFVSIRWTAIRDLGQDGIFKYTGNGASYTEAGSTNYYILMRGRGSELQYRLGDNYGITEMWATVRYTKTTDTAGSGSWTPQGVPAHHYSEDEQIVGTWNGETFYEKTYFNMSLTNGVNNLVDSNFGNDKVLQDFSVRTKGIANTLSNYNSSLSDTLFVENGELKYYVSKTGSWWSALDKVDITVQYTKSSS